MTDFCKYEIFCQPVIQCAIAKTQPYNKYLTTKNSQINFELKRNLNVEHNQIFYLDSTKNFV